VNTVSGCLLCTRKGSLKPPRTTATMPHAARAE